MDEVKDFVDLQSNLNDLKQKIVDQQEKINKYKRKIQRQSQEKWEMSERLTALMRSNNNLQEEMQRMLILHSNRPSQDQHPEYDKVPSEDEDLNFKKFIVDPDKSHKSQAKKMKDDRPELLKRIEKLSQVNNDLMIQTKDQQTEFQKTKEKLLENWRSTDPYTPFGTPKNSPALNLYLLEKDRLNRCQQDLHDVRQDDRLKIDCVNRPKHPTDPEHCYSNY